MLAVAIQAVAIQAVAIQAVAIQAVPNRSKDPNLADLRPVSSLPSPEVLKRNRLAVVTTKILANLH